MSRTIALLIPLLMIPPLSLAGDLANGERVNLRCAPCHASYGQGVPGKNAPRLAGLPDWYLAKATQDYRKGARKNPLMVEVSGLDRLSDADITDVSAYLAGLDVGADPDYDIHFQGGDAVKGKAKFEADCTTCHAKDGFGKKKKDAPPLAGQHPGYLLSSIKSFYAKDRYHDNDPIDDTFDDISDTQARDILAHLATLDDHRTRVDYRFVPSHPSPVPVNRDHEEKGGGFQVRTVAQTLLVRELEKGVEVEDAIKAMISRASALGMPRQGEPQYQGDPQNASEPAVVVLQFCSPQHVSNMIAASPLLAAYPPCRITLVTAKDARPRLLMVNMEMLIDNQLLPSAAQRVAILINQDLLAIMAAGAKGD